MTYLKNADILEAIFSSNYLKNVRHGYYLRNVVKYLGMLQAICGMFDIIDRMSQLFLNIHMF